MTYDREKRDPEKKRDFWNTKPSEYHLKIYKQHNYCGKGWIPEMETKIDMHCLKHTEYITNSKLYKNRVRIMASIDKLKSNETKLYQISGYREWKELSRVYLANIPWISYSLVKSKNLTRNAVTKIIGGYCNHYADDHKEWVKYDHTRVPVMYIEIKKYDYITLTKRLKDIKEELLAKIYHPDRISKMSDVDYLKV